MQAVDFLNDPILFQQLCWPDIRLYDKQEEILYSLRDNYETFVPAGNALGKDFVTAFAVLWFFCSRSPCRVITSSVDHPQLKGVLWGEIRRFIMTSKYPLPLQVNDLALKQDIDGKIDPRSYVIGRVTAKGEGLLGHHIERRGDKIPRTLAVFDEASGVDQEAYEATDTWAHRKLIIGNPYPCVNFFFQGVQAGDLMHPNGKSYIRKVIRIRASDSPNVRLAEQQIQQGKEPTGEILVPGVVDYDTYQMRRVLWDPIRQSIGLDAEFYEGAEVRLFPPAWLDRAANIAASRTPGSGHKKRTMGVDSGEGGDKTSWTVIDADGIIYQEARRTPDTNEIPGHTLVLMQRFGVRAEDVLFDRGGGGKQHADRLRAQGYKVQTVGFGETASDPHQDKRMRTSQQKGEAREIRYVYKNRRAEMYGMLRILIDPAENRNFGIPAEYEELRRQLTPIPLQFDDEGRLVLPSKDKKTPNSQEITLRDILGCSPDEADSLVLAVFGLERRSPKFVVRAM